MGLFDAIFGSKEDRLWDRANKFLLHNDYDDAIRIASDCISQFPNCFEAYRVRGMAYKGKKNYAQAIADLNHIIEFETNSVWGKGYRYYLRSLIYSDMGDYKNEIADLAKSIELGHTSIDAAKKKLVEAQAKL